jgi:hypothetical protein
MVLVIETERRLVDPSGVLLASCPPTKLCDVQQLTKHHLVALRLLLIWRPGTMDRKLRVLLERRVALYTEVICMIGQPLIATMLLMTDSTVGHSLCHGDWIVIVLALAMTVLTVFVVH